MDGNDGRDDDGDDDKDGVEDDDDGGNEDDDEGGNEDGDKEKDDGLISFSRQYATASGSDVIFL